MPGSSRNTELSEYQPYTSYVIATPALTPAQIFEDLNFRGQGQELLVQGQGQGLENWSSRILKDNDFPQGQQHR